jgi:hypothetical protein
MPGETQARGSVQSFSRPSQDLSGQETFEPQPYNEELSNTLYIDPPSISEVQFERMQELADAMYRPERPDMSIAPKSIYGSSLSFSSVPVDIDGETVMFNFGDILNAPGLTDKRIVILGFKESADIAVIGAPDNSGIIVEKRSIPYRELALYNKVGNL